MLAIIGMLLPRNTRVERSVTIARPASLVYATVNSFQLFSQMVAVAELGPRTCAKPPKGRATASVQKLVWAGNDKVGSGTQVITASTLDQSVASDIDFGKMGVAKSTIRLTPQGSSTRVTWTLDIDMGAGPIGHYFGLMMDRMIGKDYEKSASRVFRCRG